MTRDQLAALATNRNVDAFLHVIRQGESSQDDIAYRMVYGGGTFEAPPWNHPYAGQSAPPGKAAGAAQFIPHTWEYLALRYGFEDFSPANQDLGAIALIAERGALDDVLAGRVDAAVRKLTKVWTSLAIPSRQAEAPAIFAAYGGQVPGATPPDDPEPPADPTPPTDEVNPIMSTLGTVVPAIASLINPFLGVALSGLIDAAPQLIRLFGTPGSPMTERNAAVAEQIGAVAKQVTGAANVQAATETIQSDPQMAAQFREAVAQNFDQWMGMVVKMNDMHEASLSKARDFAGADHQPIFHGLAFHQILALFMVFVCSLGGGFVLWDPQGKFTTDMQTAVVMLMLIGGWTGIKEFFYGGSSTPPKPPQQ